MRKCDWAMGGARTTSQRGGHRHRPTPTSSHFSQTALKRRHVPTNPSRQDSGQSVDHLNGFDDSKTHDLASRLQALAAERHILRFYGRFGAPITNTRGRTVPTKGGDGKKKKKKKKKAHINFERAQ